MSIHAIQTLVFGELNTHKSLLGVDGVYIMTAEKERKAAKTLPFLALSFLRFAYGPYQQDNTGTYKTRVMIDICIDTEHGGTEAADHIAEKIIKQLEGKSAQTITVGDPEYRADGDYSVYQTLHRCTDWYLELPQDPRLSDAANYMRFQVRLEQLEISTV
jgi:hypothetical protein